MMKITTFWWQRLWKADKAGNKARRYGDYFVSFVRGASVNRLWFRVMTRSCFTVSRPLAAMLTASSARINDFTNWSDRLYLVARLQDKSPLICADYVGQIWNYLTNKQRRSLSCAPLDFVPFEDLNMEHFRSTMGMLSILKSVMPPNPSFGRYTRVDIILRSSNTTFTYFVIKLVEIRQEDLLLARYGSTKPTSTQHWPKNTRIHSRQATV